MSTTPLKPGQKAITGFGVLKANRHLNYRTRQPMGDDGFKLETPESAPLYKTIKGAANRHLNGKLTGAFGTRVVKLTIIIEELEEDTE